MPNRQSCLWPHFPQPSPTHQNTKTRLRCTPQHHPNSKSPGRPPPTRPRLPPRHAKSLGRRAARPELARRRAGPAPCAQRGPEWSAEHSSHNSSPPPTRSRDHVFIGGSFRTRHRDEPAVDANGSWGGDVLALAASANGLSPIFRVGSKNTPALQTPDEEQGATNASSSPASPRGQRACGADDAVVGGGFSSDLCHKKSQMHFNSALTYLPLSSLPSILPSFSPPLSQLLKSLQARGKGGEAAAWVWSAGEGREN